MSIKFVSVKCPDCNATLSIEENRETAFCTYCGAKVIIHNDNEHIIRKIDEAGIKKAEVEQNIRMKELELEEWKMRHEERTKVTKIRLVTALFTFRRNFAHLNKHIVCYTTGLVSEYSFPKIETDFDSF